MCIRDSIKTIPAAFGVGVSNYSSNSDLERKIAGEMFPNAPFETLSRDQLMQVRSDQRYQDRLDQGGGKTREQAKVVFSNQSHDDTELQAGRMTQEEWADRRTKRMAEYGGFLLAENGDKPIQHPRNAYEEYLNVLRTSKDEGGQLDFTKVEDWISQQSPERQALIESRTGLSDTPYVAERRKVSDSLRKAGFYELRDNAWAETKARFSGKVKAEADQFASYDDYRAEVIRQLADRLSARMDPEIAMKRAEIMVDSNGAIAAYNKRLQASRAKWAKANQSLAQQAINYGFMSASKTNLGASGSISTSGRTQISPR